jgi:hypothetical protein
MVDSVMSKRRVSWLFSVHVTPDERFSRRIKVLPAVSANGEKPGCTGVTRTLMFLSQLYRNRRSRCFLQARNSLL